VPRGERRARAGRRLPDARGVEIAEQLVELVHIVFLYDALASIDARDVYVSRARLSSLRPRPRRRRTARVRVRAAPTNAEERANAANAEEARVALVDRGDRQHFSLISIEQKSNAISRRRRVRIVSCVIELY
tara:strand:+ start:178 stop:573 length:396 start_codon:yes stop_codon:yes gene_type:complete